MPGVADDQSEAVRADPALAWHYTNGPGLISILRSHTLWATSAAFLNDRHEVQLGGRLIAERAAARAAGQGRPELDERLRRISEDGLGPAASRFYILSASQLWDSLAMWRLYGGAQESYAIGLDTREPLSVLSGRSTGEDGPGPVPGLFLQRQSWAPVRYTPERQAELADTVLDGMDAQLAELRALGIDPGQVPDSAADREAAEPDPRDRFDTQLPAAVRDKMAALFEDMQQALLLIKHPGFIDERETRYSLILQAHPGFAEAVRAEDAALNYRPTGYGIAPYLRLTGAAPGPAERTGSLTSTARALPVRAVAISPSPNGAVAADSVRRLLAASGYGEVPVLRSEIPFRG